MKAKIVFSTPVAGTVNVKHGKLISKKIFNNVTEFIVEVSDCNIATGAFPTIINVVTDNNPFSFFLRDVNEECPIYIPEFNVAVVPDGDSRSFEEVSHDIKAKGLLSSFERFAMEPEESYESACKYNLDQYCPTWLGVSRDMRMFRVGPQQGDGGEYRYWGQIIPAYHSKVQKNPDDKNILSRIIFEIGPGEHCRQKLTRHLENGCLPILHSVQDETSIQYNVTMFASLEKDLLSEKTLKGTNWLVAYDNTGYCMQTEEEQSKVKKLLEQETKQDQEVICAIRIEAVNVGKVPSYAWIKSPHMGGKTKFSNGKAYFFECDLTYAVSMVDGKPMSNEEMAILVPPGKKVVVDMLIPHSPLPATRAENLFGWNVEEHLSACRNFWLNKLAGAATIKIPELAIDERVQAGLLHCDLITLGMQQAGPLLPTIGWYAPIGTESAPIIQYYDSIGWHEIAERCIDFFLERQLESGFIQNYNNYQSETGPLLWTVGEHFRYTQNREWLKTIFPKIKKAVNYLLAWRERNQKEEYRAEGFYGMIDGKVADPDDFYHSFFLNAGTYIGLKRIAEIYNEIEPDFAICLKTEVNDYREDISNGFYYAQAKAPVIPLGDGSWAPLMPPWVEHTGGITLYADGGNWFSHGAFASRSCLTGPLWLIISEVLTPEEIGASFMIKTNQHPITVENAGLSQPYYCRHDFAHIKRNEVKAFLKTYYNQFTALQDRETYTFWEHYHHASQHKTHEEAWFLMQTRWMLYLEEGDTLSLLKAIPRRWLEDGKEIVIDGAVSYFGPIRFHALSDMKKRKVTAEIALQPNRCPQIVKIRLPHPDELKPVSCIGGAYDPATETVTVAPFNGKATVTLEF